MGGLRPIGSEKLQGMDKIKRMIEISKYKENIPQRVNENKKTEYTIGLADGSDYEIVRERQGYVIKKQISESVSEYIEPMKNRKYYSSYSQALKRLNLITKEVNSLTENKEEISLFGEQKKFKLKVPKAEGGMDAGTAPELPPPPMPAPAPAPVPDATPMPDMGEEPMPEPAPEEEPMGDEEPMDVEEPMDSEESGDDEEGGMVSFKSIQKLVGKLGQKLRSFSDNQEEGMSSNDVKYVINSVLSALDLSVLDEEDLDEIMARFEGEEEGEEDMGFEDEEGMTPEDEEAVTPEEPEAPEGEMAEDFDDMGVVGKSIANRMSKQMSDNIGQMDVYGDYGGELDEFEDMSWLEDADKNYGGSEIGFEDTGSDFSIEDEDIPFRKRGGRSRISYGDIDEIFNESKVDKILKSYLTEDVIKKSNPLYKENRSEIKRLAESVRQERGSLKFLENKPNSILLGKTNKGNLLFQEGKQKYKINKEGKVE
jgi:hypothetical protein